MNLQFFLSHSGRDMSLSWTHIQRERSEVLPPRDRRIKWFVDTCWRHSHLFGGRYFESMLPFSFFFKFHPLILAFIHESCLQQLLLWWLLMLFFYFILSIFINFAKRCCPFPPILCLHSIIYYHQYGFIHIYFIILNIWHAVLGTLTSS